MFLLFIYHFFILYIKYCPIKSHKGWHELHPLFWKPYSDNKVPFFLNADTKGPPRSPETPSKRGRATSGSRCLPRRPLLGHFPTGCSRCRHGHKWPRVCSDAVIWFMSCKEDGPGDSRYVYAATPSYIPTTSYSYLTSSDPPRRERVFLHCPLSKWIHTSFS